MRHLGQLLLKKTSLAALLALLMLAMPRAQTPQAQTPRAPARIICLVPAVTETLFAVGAGPQVAAVSSFDNYPPEVEKLQRVGALLDPDVERILSLRPDLVVVYGSQTDLRAQLDRAHIQTFIYSHGGLAEVTATIRAIGDRVGHGPEATRLAGDIHRRIAAVRKRVAGLPRVRTLVVFEREPRSLRGIYASGGIGFVHDMIEAAGGVNVFADVKREAVQATTELILARQPEAIIELRSAAATDDERRLEIATWDRLGALPAVRSHRVHLFADQKMSIAGPRVAEVVEILGRTLHPGAFAR
ncbi:MAG: ABC transporter substrate-binding protein [Acidobacteriota bacterium]